MAKVKPNADKSAKPGTKDTTAKKIEKVMYPGLKPDDDGKATVKVKGVPEDFNSKKHKPLKRRDFECESTWFELKAVELDKRAADYRKMAADIKKLGSVADRAKAKKLLAMQRKMAELQAQLKEQGIDVDELLAGDDDE